MKATPSQDGEVRFTVRIPHRIGLDAMIDGLGWYLTSHNCHTNFYEMVNKAMAVEAALKPLRSRKAIMDAAIKSIAAEGANVWVWADNCEFREVIREQARVLVLKKYPELSPQRKAVET